MFGCHSCGQKLKHLMRLGCSEDTTQSSWQSQAPATKMKVAKKAGNMGQHGSTRSWGDVGTVPLFKSMFCKVLFRFFEYILLALLDTTVLEGLHFTRMNQAQTCQTLQQTQALKCFNILILKMTLFRLLLSHRQALAKGVHNPLHCKYPPSFCFVGFYG